MKDAEVFKKRFNSKTLPENESGCKLWINGKGWYGTFRIGNKLVKSHRAAYMLFVGEIPEGMQVCHKCDVKDCVNPEHLFLGTQKDNLADMRSKGRWRSGNYGDHLKLSQAMADVIYWDQRSHQAIADDYGISRTLVGQIKNHKIWRERESLTEPEKDRFKAMAQKLSA